MTVHTRSALVLACVTLALAAPIASGQGDLDNTRIVFPADWFGHQDLYSVRPDGSDLRQLTHGSEWENHPSWSPDGTSLAFASNRNGNGNWDIYTMNSDGTQVTQLTDNPSSDLEPVWSPDGARLAFTSNRNGVLEVFLIDISGRTVTATSQAGIPSDWRLG
mgnify:CR=1 FL=1